MVEYLFDVRTVIFRLVDVGVQRSEMRKWMHYFEDVISVIFLVALTDYNQRSHESDHSNRLEESKSLFRTIITRPWIGPWTRPFLVLFFNKTDLFAEQIMKSDLADYFPEFTGPAKDPEAAQKFILRMFIGMNPDCLLYTSPSPRDLSTSRMPSSA